MSHFCSSRAGRRCGASRGVVFLLVAGLFFGIAPTTTLPAQAGRAAALDRHAVPIAEAARRFSIPAHWIAAVLHTESAGDVHAISSAGAMGLMQIMPDTWAELRARHRLGNDPFSVRDNIMAGAAYLREMFDRYGNVGAMLAAYNAGPGRYDEHLATGRPLPAETRAYVAALVPEFDGEPLPEDLASAPAVPTDWREAPLFVARFGITSDALSVQSDAAVSVDSVTGEHRLDATKPASVETLFPRTDDGGQP
jgi:hypothetical protein